MPGRQQVMEWEAANRQPIPPAVQQELTETINEMREQDPERIEANKRMCGALDKAAEAAQEFGIAATGAFDEFSKALASLETPTGKPPKRWIAPGAREAKNGLR